MTSQDRIAALRESLQAPLLVTKAANLRYLTGYVGSNGYLLVDDTRVVFVTDGRYGEIAEGLMAEVADSDVVVYDGKLEVTLAGLIEGDITLESEAVTWSFVTTLAEAATGEITPGGGAVERMRRVKDDEEVDRLRAAATAGDIALEQLELLAEGAATEAELAWGLVTAMKRAGGDVAEWDPIVAVGRNAARPHHETGDTALGDGLLLVDYGCAVDGYHSDMSRTLWRGDAGPSAAVQRLYDAVLEAQEAALAAVGPGISAGDVDRAARDVLDAAGLGEAFLHSTGHGVGLEIHEEPWVRKGSDEILEPGNVITVEPGAYVTGTGGVRIEDMVLVTDSGSEVLTRSPKGLR
jgi:Xaa-Pro aminopeptidase